MGLSADIGDCGTQGLSYVAGYIARKFNKKYPDLGQKTCDLNFIHGTSSPWIVHLSNGGLTVPAEDFFEACCKFEKSFVAFHSSHKNLIDQEPDVISRMHRQLVCHFPEWPSDVLLFFAKTRTFIRLKYVNHNLKVQEAKAKLRKLKQVGQFTC